MANQASTIWVKEDYGDLLLEELKKVKLVEALESLNLFLWIAYYIFCQIPSLLFTYCVDLKIVG